VGLSALLQAIAEATEALLPGEGSIALNRRQAALIDRAAAALDEVDGVSDPAVAAELLRRARLAFEQLTGRAGVEDVLDSLFSRFCLGK
jgi:tRNA modification GTPase